MPPFGKTKMTTLTMSLKSLMSNISVSETAAFKMVSLLLCKTKKEKVEDPIKKTTQAKEIRPMLIVVISTRKPSE